MGYSSNDPPNDAMTNEFITNEVSSLLHDVRNPLNTISINAELGKLVLQRNGDVEKAIKVLEVILQECRNCNDKLSELSKAVFALANNESK